ncbi:MAG: 50S ribosomal protein L3 [Candidatus Jordarchaeales archaeon]|nr:50S ribosomal protein L3 [Candidatus Jordarchaeia archaeon]
MGHRKYHAPKRGSLAYLPKGRASRPVARVRNWPLYSGPTTLLGMPGYKAGMTHTIIVDNRKTSPYYGKELALPVTVLDTPPLTVFAVRAYENTPYGLRTLSEVWSPNLSKDLARSISCRKLFEYSAEERLEKFRKNLDRLLAYIDRISEVRVLAHTQPRLASVPKKKPEVLEIKVGGGNGPKDLLLYASRFLGEELYGYTVEKLGGDLSKLGQATSTISIRDVFSEGDYVDVIAVTKGKGFQGPVKRWGVRILQHKSRKTKRGVGTLGAWHPNRVPYTTPRAGQMGYHQRTEYNKYILKIGNVNNEGEDINPKGGFVSYGLVKGDYVILLGSVPGPAKRLVFMRYPIRPSLKKFEEVPMISFISTESKQGV